MPKPFAGIALTAALVAQASLGGAQVAGDPEARDGSAERAARQAIRTFMTEWNAGDDARLRRVLHFPFVTVAGGGALVIDSRPEDFSQGFDQLRERDGWTRSSFDDDSYTAVRSSPDKVHAEIDFSRYGADGTPYLSSRVFLHPDQVAGSRWPRTPTMDRVPTSSRCGRAKTGT